MIRIVANTRIPTEKANGLQTMKMAAALAASGEKVALWVPTRFPPREVRGVRDPFLYYGVGRGFRIRFLPSIDLVTPLARHLPPFLARAVFYIQGWSFSLAAVLAALFVRRAVFYSRDVYFFLLFAPIAPVLGKRVYLEAHHAIPRLAGVRRVALRRAAGVVAITKGLAEDLESWGAARDRILVLPDAADPAAFENVPARDAARRELGLDPTRPTVVYAGHLYPWKGIETLLAAAPELDGIELVIVGGTEEDRRRLAPTARAAGGAAIRFVGHVPPARVPIHLAAADCLVLPNSGKETISRRYTSPLKLFEYLAAGRPIVASDLASLREVLEDGVTAVLVPPDDPRALAAGIRRILAEPGLANRLAEAGKRKSREFTWARRAGRLREFLAKTTP